MKVLRSSTGIRKVVARDLAAHHFAHLLVTEQRLIVYRVIKYCFYRYTFLSQDN